VKCNAGGGHVSGIAKAQLFRRNTSNLARPERRASANDKRTGNWIQSDPSHSVMILPQVHLRNGFDSFFPREREQECVNLSPTFLQGPDHILSSSEEPPTTIWPVNSIHSAPLRGGHLRTWLRIAHFLSLGGDSYLKLLPYPGLLARPRRRFRRRLVLRSLGCSRNLAVSPGSRQMRASQTSI
jgi:hypothetical protein